MILLCITLAILILLYVSKRYKELCPVKVFTYFWSGQILLLVIGGYGYLNFTYSGILFILLCLIAMNVGTILAGGTKISHANLRRNRSVCIKENQLLKLTIFVSILGFVQPIETIVRQGFNLSQLLDFTTLLEINNTLSVIRYEDDAVNDQSLISRIIGVFAYLAPLLGGFLLSVVSSKKHKIICYFSILPQLFAGLTQGVKMGIITSVILLITGYICCCFLLNKEIKFTRKVFFYGAISFVLFISVLLISMMFRIGHFDLDTFNIVKGKFISYAFGHLPAFDIWFEKQSFIPQDLTFGGYFFMGITNFVGVIERKAGLFQEFTSISNFGDQTNVYTLFRILMEDFGMLGTLAFCLLLGLIMQKMYLNVRLLRYYRFSLVCLSAFYFMTFWSFVTSVFVYTSYIVMFIFFYAIIAKNISCR